MTNDLITQVSITKDFCFYIVRVPNIIMSNKIHSYNYTDELVRMGCRCIFRAEYANALSTQKMICNNNAVSVSQMLELMRYLEINKLIPSQYYLDSEIVLNSKKLTYDLKMTTDKTDKLIYHNTSLMRYKMKHSLLSYLIQKESDIINKIYRSEYMHHFRALINILKEFDTNSASSVKFDDAVEALYQKNIKLLLEDH